MRNKVIRIKRLRAERAVDDYMRMPSRIVTGADHRDTNWKELQDSRLWVVPEVHVRGAAPKELFGASAGRA